MAPPLDRRSSAERIVCQGLGSVPAWDTVEIATEKKTTIFTGPNVQQAAGAAARGTASIVVQPSGSSGLPHWPPGYTPPKERSRRRHPSQAPGCTATSSATRTSRVSRVAVGTDLRKQSAEER